MISNELKEGVRGVDPSSLFSVQNRRLIKLTTPAINEQELLLESFSGTEAVSALFNFELTLLSQDARLELKSLIGQPAQLEIELATGEPRYIHGFISRFSLQDSDNGLARYTATLSPWLWMLSRRQDSRVFQEQTVEAIIRSVLAGYGTLPVFEFRLIQPLKIHSYITQYRESDQAFVMRLLEQEGLFFYFVHEKNRHTLFVSDYSQSLTPIPQQPQIRYHSASVTELADSITQWSSHRTLQPGRMSLRTFDYKQPRNALSVGIASVNEQGTVDPYEIYDLSGHYTHATGQEGEVLARRRLEALEVQGKTFKGASNCRAMGCGYTFELTQHFDHDRDIREDRQFLLLSVEHRGSNNYLSDQPASYHNNFECIRHKIPFRPLAQVPRPIISGPLTAIVVGPEGEEVFTDELARVQVRFHWQREQDPCKDTTWLRVAMPSAGEGFGHQFLPRIGQEVLVTFLAGDIDRPVVTSVLYNGDHSPPRFSNAAGLPGNRTLSGIQTREHKGRGFNELLFDDTPGELRARMATTHHATELNLGKLAMPRTDGKAQPRGNGAELRTDAAIALRAAQGMLLTTYARHGAQGSQLDREELLALLEECGDLFQSLGQTAAARGGQQVDSQGIEALRQSLNQWPTADSNQAGAPIAALAAEAGIVSATPRSQVHYAGQNHDTLAQDNLHMTSGAAMHLHAGKGISAFAQDDGINVIANRGKVLVQAQEDDIALNAQKNLQLSATEGEVLISAPTIRLVADDGSYIKIGGGVEIGTQGKAIVHAGEHDWVGPKSDSVVPAVFGRDSAAQRLAFHYPGHDDKNPRLAGDHAYQIEVGDGSVMQGVTDAAGLTERVEREVMHRAQVTASRKGVNERLDRPDLKAGRYGAEYSAAKALPIEELVGEEKQILDDPDTYLYRRDTTDPKTRSLLIPFYWGYRAAPEHIKRDDAGDPFKMRNQYQDVHGNRLDRHFAKAGGYFTNATNNLNEMYGEGFKPNIKSWAANKTSNYLYFDHAPLRHYFVMAAHRLAMLVREIRRLSPDETITIMGHSQGTLISLLAQALLVDDNQRCADTVIMVDSPYSVLPEVTPKGSDTLATLICIVTAITQAPHAQPPLADLRNPQTYGGRSGPRWSPEKGTRLDKNQKLTVFPERDNRGKVYLYFCPDDTTVALKDVQGIGTFGMPDVLPNGTPAMTALHSLRFYQRMWTKRHRDGEPVLVGKTAQPEQMRAGGESYHPGGWSLPALVSRAGIRAGRERHINAEALHPPHAPHMFGGEAISGTPTTSGLDRPDDVGKSVALGKESAKFQWVQMPAEYDPPLTTQREALARFNAQNDDPEDHTRAVRKSTKHSHHEREETPREARARMEVDSNAWEENSYHSGVLRSPENHRWVTAMDIAIGQARCLDDPVMREVLVAIADWKLDKEQFEKVEKLPGWSRLSTQARLLVSACHKYYHYGVFPSSELVSLTPPTLVTGAPKKGAGQ